MAPMNWATHVLQWEKQSVQRNINEIINFFLSSDWLLQLATIKMESLVIVDQDATVNLYLDLVHTARHMLGVCLVRSWKITIKQRFELWYI